MSNLSDDDEIRQLFIDESLEGLQRSERLLLDAEEGRTRPDLVDVLFRDFHTIKGTSALLGYDRIASLGHAAEDLMSRLRDKSIDARPHHFARMVEVIDTLRMMIESIRDANSEGTAEVEPLVKLLREDLERGNDAPAEAAPPAPSIPTPAPTAPAPAPTVPTAPPVAAAPPPPPKSPFDPLPVDTSPAPGETHAPETHDHVEEKQKHESADGTVRVNVGVLDKLMNLMGELVLARNQMIQTVRGLGYRIDI